MDQMEQEMGMGGMGGMGGAGKRGRGCMGGSSSGGGDAISDEGTAMCSAHGRKRTMRNLEDDGMGGFKCSRNNQCQGTGPTGSSGQNFAPGDWACPACGDHQFARNSACRKCGQEKPDGAGADNLAPGDWLCPACKDHQFARNAQCRRCGEPKPDRVAPY